jgi:SulP family sulfate permease
MGASVIVRNVVAGMVVGIVAVVYALSYAAVIFAGDLSAALPYGVAITLVTAVVVTGITSAFGTIPFGIAGPDIYSVLPLAV